MTTNSVSKVIENAYRAHWGELTAILARQFGAGQMDLVETVVQEAFVKAMEKWPTEGVPDNPVAWLLTVARNLRFNQARQSRNAERLEDAVVRHIEQAEAKLVEANVASFETEIRDDQLRMMFVCNHPGLSDDARIPLTLRTLCGFETKELARAYLISEEALKKRLVRARSQIRELGIDLDLPDASHIDERLDSVLATLYLLFSEGYAPHDGDRHVRHELATEAIRLTDFLVNHPLTGAPKVHALLALLYFQASRFNARLDEHGAPLVLKDQDRSLWDQTLIRRGFIHLAAAASGEELSRYHLESSIAACHARAASFEETDWKMIASLYEMLLEHFPSDIAAVGHAIAVGQRSGAEAGLKLLTTISKEGRLKSYGPLHAARGEFLLSLGQTKKAIQAFQEAHFHAQTEPDRLYLQRRLKALEA